MAPGGELTWPPTIIYGDANSFHQSKYNIHFFTKEIGRSPHFVSYFIAMVDGTDIFIRQENCELIFFKKWLPVIESFFPKYANFHINTSPESVSAAIKWAAIKSFGIRSRSNFLLKKDIFIDVMMRLILQHEMAHGIEHDGEKYMTESACSEGISCQKNNILGALTEVFTEFLPEKNGIMGPIRHIVNTAISSGNRKEAMQMLLIYFSDSWFLDTETTFMYSYNYIMYIIFLKYLKGTNDFDFESLDADFNYVYEKIHTIYLNTTREFIALCKTIVFYKDGVQKSFDDITGLIKGLVGLSDLLNGVTKSPAEKENNLWYNIFIRMKLDAPEFLENLFRMLEEREEVIYKELMTEFATKDNAEKFVTDARGYILFKMNQIGFNTNEL